MTHISMFANKILLRQALKNTFMLAAEPACA